MDDQDRQNLADNNSSRKSFIKAPQKGKKVSFKGLMEQSWVICQLLNLISSSFRTCLDVVVIDSKNSFVNCAVFF